LAQGSARTSSDGPVVSIHRLKVQGSRRALAMAPLDKGTLSKCSILLVMSLLAVATSAGSAGYSRLGHSEVSATSTALNADDQCQSGDEHCASNLLQVRSGSDSSMLSGGGSARSRISVEQADVEDRSPHSVAAGLLQVRAGEETAGLLIDGTSVQAENEAIAAEEVQADLRWAPPPPPEHLRSTEQCCRCQAGTIGWSASGQCYFCRGQIALQKNVGLRCRVADWNFLGNQACANQCKAFVGADA